MQNGNVGVFDGGAGDSATVVGAGAVRITGVGRNTPGGEEVQDEDVIVLYATSDAVAALSGERGFDRLAILLRDPDRGSETVQSVRRYLDTVPGFAGFIGLPELREPGDWPGKAETQAFADLLAVITLLALLSAARARLEHDDDARRRADRRDHHVRAIGARRRQVALVMSDGALLGLLGALVGVARSGSCSPISSRVLRDDVLGDRRRLRHRCTVVVASMAVGVLAPVLAALPAIRRAVRVDLREALQATGSAVGAQGAAIAPPPRAFLPRTGADRPARSRPAQAAQLATALIVAFAGREPPRRARARGRR